MMPGDSQSKTVPIAADATVGNCQNCSVLHQTLNEYVSSLLALKQKITVTDDSIGLQQQLEELQIRLVTLEKRTVDYDSLQEELEEKKGALKVYGQMSEEMEHLKQENSKTVAEKNKLEDELKDMKELTDAQSLENAQLKREKAAVENDLLKTQATLKKAQAQADQMERTLEEKAKITSIKDNLENNVRLLEDTVCKQKHQISQLTKERILLETHMNDLQVRLMKLEKERNKEYRSVSTQASAPEEPKVDKEKFRLLLENLWTCVEPQQKDAANLLHLPGFRSTQVLPSSPPKKRHSHLSYTSPSASNKITESHRSPTQRKAACAQLKVSPAELPATETQSCLSKSAKRHTDTPKKTKRLFQEHKAEASLTNSGGSKVSFEEIMALFKPMLPCLSPLPDLATELDSMEIDDGEKENHPSESVPPQQQESPLNAAAVSSHCGNPSTAPTEGNEELPVVSTQEVEHISGGDHSKDSGQNGLSGITDTKDIRSTGGEDMQQQQQQQEQPGAMYVESTSPTSVSSSTSEKTALAEVTSLTPECQRPSSSVTNHSFGESENASGKAEEDQPEDITEMDVETNPSADAGAKTSTPGDGETTRKGDETSDVWLVTSSVTASITSSVTSAEVVDSVSEAKIANAESCPEMGQGHQDSCDSGPDDQDLTASKDHQNKGCLGEDVPEQNPCLSGGGDNSSGVSKENVQEKLENDASLKTPEEDGNEAQGTEEVHEAALPSQLNNDNRPQSPHQSPTMEAEEDEPLADQESGPAHFEKPSEKDVLSGERRADHTPSPADSHGTKALLSPPLMQNGYSLSRGSSPSDLLASVKSQPLETNQNQEQVSANGEPVSTDKETVVSNLEQEVVCEKAAVKDMPRDSVHQYPQPDKASRSVSPELKQNGAATDGQNTCLESSRDVLEKQSPRVCGEEGSAPAQSESLGLVRTEMGPPLPLLLTPLTTPPKAGKSINPRQAIGKLSFPSPLDRLASPTTPVQAHLTPNGQRMSSSCVSSPLPPNGVPSSPLQFGSATPKHAVPVPGRLPSTVNSSPSSSSSPSHENSMRIFDTMYPDLSAHARTLSILRGNVSLSICSSESGTLPAKAVCQMSGFKSINSTSTAFTKTETRGEKRQSIGLPGPKNRKCLKLDNCSPPSSHKQEPPSSSSSSSSMGGGETTSPETLRLKQLTNETTSPSMEVTGASEQNLIAGAFKKIEKQCFDLLPVIKSHVHVGKLPLKPVLRDEEKEVISEICQSSVLQTDTMISAILNKLKAQKGDLSRNYMQALCRVYIGICRQRRDWEKAHLLAYSILTEDFPHSAELILFMVTTWPSVLSHSSTVCQAIHTVTKLTAEENLLGCLSAFLGWEKNPPWDIDQLISRTLSDVQSGSSSSFVKHSRHGDDLGTEAWEQVFTLHLLCAHKTWKWTFDQVMGNKLWPIMNTWVSQPRGQQTPISDVTVATVLRLIGRLGQVGIKKKCISSVKTVAEVINMFGKHASTEGVPWEVQLAAIYSMYELSPCHPKQTLDFLAEWRGETTQAVPPAITSCINQLASVCRQVKS